MTPTDDLSGLIERRKEVKRMLRMQPGYTGTRDKAEAWIDEAATALSTLKDERDKVARERDRLFDAFMWIDGWEPETTAAVEKRFGLDIFNRVVEQIGQSTK